ncbi:MAG: DNA repair protein RecN [Clostridiales bacterium]|nr:DNA repair protein RecN [Clostridiales bacterium]
MLKQLYIENIAVIEKNALELDEGFNLLTGETGAGKSIIIDSIHAILGERTSRELIRTGCEQATVSALFADLGVAASAKLEELGFSAEEDGSLLLQRTLRADGKGSCRIGGRPATVSILRELGRTLVDIHGQHDNQALLNPEGHMRFVDALADNAGLLADYQETYQRVKALQREWKALQMDDAEKARRTDLLSFQVRELEEAHIRLGEREELTARRTVIQNGEHIVGCLQAACAALCGEEEAAGALPLLEAAVQSGREAGRYLPGLDETGERLTAIQYELEEIADRFRQELEEVEFDPKELEQIEERLDQLYRLSRKYGESEEDMLDFLEKASRELESIVTGEARLAELESRLDAEKALLQKKGAALTASRLLAGERLDQAVCRELAFLNMPGVQFITRRSQGVYTAAGADQMEFFISANPGEPPRPLSKIASGGELSRIMLAIKSVLAGHDQVDTLIFDEIDTGISGRAAQQVGVKLKEVSRRRQVICITHLAQIAAMADRHMLIEKQVQDGRTYTEVKPLQGDARINEIARIMSGGEITEHLRRTALDMLESGKKV